MVQQQHNFPQFYLTVPTPCPYLPGRMEQKIFVNLFGDEATQLNNMLSQAGFRRSQAIAYRPNCQQCQACVSVRVRVEDFCYTRSFKRIVKTNRDLVGAEQPIYHTSEQYALFRDYIATRHHNGGMNTMSVQDYAMMVEESPVDSFLVEYRKRGPDTALTGRGTGKLYAVALSDRLADGLSLVYSFFDTDETKRSLGSYIILDYIARCRKLGLPYLYLGFWVAGSQKMDYKLRFQPQEHITSEGWMPYQS